MATSERFSFQRILTPLGFVHLPIAGVRLDHGSSSIELDMTIDSGADLTMIPLQVGLGLGMSAGKSPIRYLSGITGGLPYILRRLTIQLGRTRFPIRHLPAVAPRTNS